MQGSGAGPGGLKFIVPGLTNRDGAHAVDMAGGGSGARHGPCRAIRRGPMKVLDSILNNLLAESEATKQRALATSGEVRRETQGVRGRGLQSLQGREPLRLRSLLATVRERAQALVSGMATSVFGSSEGAEITSSRPSIATAEVVSDTGRARTSRLEIKVTQLAKAQINQGQALNDSSSTGIQTGTNSFTISLGSQPPTTVSVEISQGDSNLRALEKVEDAINSTDAGVTAELVSNSDAGTSYLRLSANETGRENAFSLSDATGNVISTTGVSSIQTEAEDANYVLNGRALTSGSNSVLVDNGRIEIALKGVSGPAGTYKETAAIVEIGPDPVPGAILELAEGFNRLREFLKDAGTESSRSLLNAIDQIASGHGSALRDVGLTRDSEGAFTVDRAALEKQLSSDPAKVEEALGGKEGFATALYGASSGLLADSVSDLAGRRGQLVSYGFSVRDGFLGTSSVFGRGAHVNLTV